MRHLPVLLCVLLSSVTLGAEKTVFRCDFDRDTAPGRGEGRLVAGFEQSRSLLIARAVPGSCRRQFPLPAEAFSDRFATLHAVVKAADISEPPQSWNGIKVMLVLETASGARHYPQIPIPTGTFDWKPMRHTIRLPADIKSAVSSRDGPRGKAGAA